MVFFKHVWMIFYTFSHECYTEMKKDMIVSDHFMYFDVALDREAE